LTGLAGGARASSLVAMRAGIVLRGLDGMPEARIARELGVSRSTVHLWTVLRGPSSLMAAPLKNRAFSPQSVAKSSRKIKLKITQKGKKFLRENFL
jgi:transposase